MGAVAVLLDCTWGRLFAGMFAHLFVDLNPCAYWPSRGIETRSYTLFPLVFVSGMALRAREHFRATQRLREESIRMAKQLPFARRGQTCLATKPRCRGCL